MSEVIEDWRCRELAYMLREGIIIKIKRFFISKPEIFATFICTPKSLYFYFDIPNILSWDKKTPGVSCRLFYNGGMVKITFYPQVKWMELGLPPSTLLLSHSVSLTLSPLSLTLTHSPLSFPPSANPSRHQKWGKKRSTMAGGEGNNHWE